MPEQIDELRALLDLPDRSAVTVTMLQGLRETTTDEDAMRSFALSGDVAYIIVGPAANIEAQMTEQANGEVTFTFTPRGWKQYPLDVVRLEG